MTRPSPLQGLLANDFEYMRGFWKLTALLLVVPGACTRNGNIFDAPVALSKADVTCSIQGHEIQPQTPLPIGISAIHICDSVMMLKTSNSASGFQIHALSLYDFASLGHYLTKGRGAGELITPIIKNDSKDENGDENIALFDLNSCSMFYFNLSESIKKNKTIVNLYAKLPPGTTDAYICDGTIITLMPESDDYVCCIYDNDGNRMKMISLFPEVSGLSFLDKLSSANTVCPDRRKMIMAMCMLPQINILDLDTGEKRSVAVKKGYRNWKNILNADNENQNIYYTAITQSSDWIITLYHDSTFLDWVRNNTVPHVHIYDWEGRFKYDIKVNEKLKAISYDEFSNILYGVDVDDVIYKYDFSRL